MKESLKKEVIWLLSRAKACAEYAWSDDPLAASYKKEGEHCLDTVLVIAKLLEDAGYIKASTDIVAAAEGIKI